MRKLLIATVAALALLSAPAKADTADGIVYFIVYDNKCEKLPAIYKSYAAEASTTVSSADIEAATLRVFAQYKRMGPSTFCESVKPLIERGMRRLLAIP